MNDGKGTRGEGDSRPAARLDPRAEPDSEAPVEDVARVMRPYAVPRDDVQVLGSEAPPLTGRRSQKMPSIEPRARSSGRESMPPNSESAAGMASLRHRLAALQNQLADAQRQLACEQEERAEDADKIAQMLERVANTDERVTAAESRLADARHELDEARRVMEELRISEQLKEDANEVLRKETGAHMAAVEDLRREVNEARAAALTAQAELESARAELEKRQAEVEESKAGAERAKRETLAQTEELAKVNGNLKQANMKTLAANKQLESWKAESQRMMDQLRTDQETALTSLKTEHAAALDLGEKIATDRIEMAAKSANDRVEAAKNEAEVRFQAANKEADKRLQATSDEADARIADAAKQADEHAQAATRQADERVLAATKEADDKILAAKKLTDEQVQTATRQADEQVQAATKNADEQVLAATRLADEAALQAASSKREADERFESVRKQLADAMFALTGARKEKDALKVESEQAQARVEQMKRTIEATSSMLTLASQSLESAEQTEVEITRIREAAKEKRRQVLEQALAAHKNLRQGAPGGLATGGRSSVVPTPFGGLVPVPSIPPQQPASVSGTSEPPNRTPTLPAPAKLARLPSVAPLQPSKKEHHEQALDLGVDDLLEDEDEETRRLQVP